VKRHHAADREAAAATGDVGELLAVHEALALAVRAAMDEGQRVEGRVLRSILWSVERRVVRRVRRCVRRCIHGRAGILGRDERRARSAGGEDDGEKTPHLSSVALPSRT